MESKIASIGVCLGQAGTLAQAAFTAVCWNELSDEGEAMDPAIVAFLTVFAPVILNAAVNRAVEIPVEKGLDALSSLLSSLVNAMRKKPEFRQAVE